MSELERLRAGIKALADKWDQEAQQAMSMYGKGQRPKCTGVRRQHANELMRLWVDSSTVCNQGHTDLHQCDVGVCDAATPSSQDAMAVTFDD